MLREVLELLDVKDSGSYLDATLGLGGHSLAILARLGGQGKLLGMDRDLNALTRASARLQDARCTFVHGAFSQMAQAARQAGFQAVDGVLMDLGVSMMQLKDSGRGFSFQSDAPLDMRMDCTSGPTAAELVNNMGEQELADLIFRFGEERASRRIARGIVWARERSRIETCSELASIIARSMGGRGRIHPATRTFQALRIAVNDEIGQLTMGLDAALDILAPSGRLVVISYHSLEDREVKHYLRARKQEGRLRLLTPKPLVPERAEQVANPSARSAKLRAAEVCA